ncbi:MAG: hypothetical protein M9897_05330 [Brumimicrobium sp.]|nr:hypothetical protein [Brumimicrobium sp.]
MKPSKELFYLIKSLTKSEKRFFKLSSSIQSGEKNYFRLFDYIDGENDYNEEQVKKYFEGETFIKHLPSEKNHLYKLILKSLRQFYGDQSASGAITQEIKNIEILYGKALYIEAAKLLKRTKISAHENEKFYYIIELLALEKLLIEAFYEAGDFGVDLGNIIKEESDVIDKLRNLSEYHILYSRINAIFRRNVFVKNTQQREEVDAIANHHLIKGKNTALSYRAASICYYIQGLCAATHRDFELSYEKFNRVRKILDDHPVLKLDLGERYILTLSHLIHCYMHEKNYQKAQQTINEIRELKGKKGFNSIHLTQEINNIIITDQIRLFNIQGEFEEALSVYEKEYLSDISVIENSNKEQRIKFYYIIAYTLYAVKDYKKSLQFINLILNDNEQQLRQDLYSYSRILNLLIHFELENYDFMEYSSKSTIRFLNKTETDYQIEEIFVKQIRKIAKVATQLEVISIFKETLEQVEELLINEQEQIILDYIDIISWLNSKISGEEFTDMVKQKSKS